MRTVGRLMVTVGICLVLAFGLVALGGKSEAALGGCVCPMVYAPVKCSNGKTYSNLCVANCNHATGCVPVIVLPPPV